MKECENRISGSESMKSTYIIKKINKKKTVATSDD